MTVEIRGKHDSIVDSIGRALELFQVEHPGAKISLYRQNPASIRIRIIDKKFDKMRSSARNDYVWDWLESHWEGPDDDLGDISMLILLTPSEVKKSMANMEFEDPVPSGFES